MKTNQDNPVDPLGSLGPAIKPKAPKQPDPIKTFEQQSDALCRDYCKELQDLISAGQADDWKDIA